MLRFTDMMSPGALPPGRLRLVGARLCSMLATAVTTPGHVQALYADIAISLTFKALSDTAF
jgi:hypothetical protein